MFLLFRPAYYCANSQVHFKVKKIYTSLFLLTASKSRDFVWTEDHDVLMLREAVTSEPYNFKPKSSERGRVWESIAAYLNSLKTPEFRVTVRAVRDRYALLISRHKLKQTEEEKASGIDVPEPTELDTLLEEIGSERRAQKKKVMP